MIAEGPRHKPQNHEAPLATPIGLVVPGAAIRIAQASSGVPQLAGITLRRVIGQGASAVVYEAVDAVRGEVAVKILRESRPDLVNRFRTECELVRRVPHPSVVPIYDVRETSDGLSASVLELVRGPSLKALLADGTIHQGRALSLAIELARALEAVHAAGVIHRDVKPSNVLVDQAGQVRLIDFGVAKDMLPGKQSGATRRLNHTAGVGTPSYLSPEQIRGEASCPGTDIWAFGIVLYELLTGVVPFSGGKLQELTEKVLTQAPAPPSHLNPGLPAEIDAFVLRCLEKDPKARFRSCRDLVRALEQLLVASARPAEHGAIEPAFARTPGAPGAASLKLRNEAALHYTWSFSLESDPRDLWPHVSDTENVNRAIGLPPVSYVNERGADGSVQRIGRFKKLGMEIEWVEAPFEWVAPEWQAVQRVYRRGPFAGLWSQVTLTPREGGGTTLVHEVWVQPRGLLGRLVSFFEVRLKAHAALERTYGQIDARIARARTGAGSSQIFERSEPLAAEAEARLEAGLRQLREGPNPIRPRLVEQLANAIRRSPETQANGFRPYGLARRWHAPRPDVLRLLAQASHAGLVEPVWSVLCPACTVPTLQLSTLAQVRPWTHCNGCETSFDASFAESVELVFRPHPDIRPLSGATYCIGGPGHTPPIVSSLSLEAGETRRITLVLAPGAYRLSVPGIAADYTFVVKRESLAGAADVTLTAAGAHPGPAILRAGAVRFAIRNADVRPRHARVENVDWRQEVLTAFEAAGRDDLPAFLSDDRLGNPISVQRATFLAVAPDATSGPEVAAWLEKRFAAAVDARGGVATHGQAALAAFVTPTAALATALELARAALEASGPGMTGSLRLAVTQGPALLLRAAGFVRYDGEGPNAALALLEGCRPGELALTHDVLGASGARETVSAQGTRIQVCRGPGGRELPVVYTTPRLGLTAARPEPSAGLPG